MSHKVTLTIPNDCTVEQFEGLLKDNGISYEDTKYKTISYSKLTIYLVDAIKELTKRIEDLEERFVKK